MPRYAPYFQGGLRSWGAWPLALTALLAAAPADGSAQRAGAAYVDAGAGTLTVKLVVDHGFSHPCAGPVEGRCDGGVDGEKFAGTIHRELGGATRLDQVMSTGKSAVGGEDASTADGAPPNAIEQMQKEVEKCEGDMQCITAVGTRMAGGMGGAGDASPMSVAMRRFRSWTPQDDGSRDCFSGTASVRESYDSRTWDVHEGGGEWVSGHWTVIGSTAFPTSPARFTTYCGFQLVVDTQGDTYDLEVDPNPEVDVRSTFGSGSEDTERLWHGTPGNIVIRGQKLPPAGGPLSGSLRLPGYVLLADGSRADAVFTWSFELDR